MLLLESSKFNHQRWCHVKICMLDLDAFIQSDLHCFQGTHLHIIISFPGCQTHDFGIVIGTVEPHIVVLMQISYCVVLILMTAD